MNQIPEENSNEFNNDINESERIYCKTCPSNILETGKNQLNIMNIKSQYKNQISKSPKLSIINIKKFLYNY